LTVAISGWPMRLVRLVSRITASVGSNPDDRYVIGFSNHFRREPCGNDGH
jgi:hypothetical protein